MRHHRASRAPRHRLGATILLSIAIWATPALAGATEAEIDYAEGVVRTVYYEGIPHDAADAISESGAARLSEMLGEPGERAHHANILMCLGISGHAGSYQALVGYLAQLRDGEIGRPEFRAWRLVPVAMGHLARQDPRALRWLIAQLGNPSREDWSFLRHDLPGLRRRGAILGLGVSGMPGAAVALNDYAARALARSSVASSASNSARNREIGVALDLHQRVASAGPGSLGVGKAEQ